MNRPLLSILILNYDTLDFLESCVKSIFDCDLDFAVEVIVVNNGSPSDTADEIKRLDSRLVVFDLPVNVGFGQGNNLAASQARGEYLLLLNSDTQFLDRSLSRFHTFVRENPDVDLFGCQVFYPSGQPQQVFRNCRPESRYREVTETLLPRNPIWEKLRRRRETPEEESPRHPYWIGGCCIFVKHAVFEETGGFDPDFFLYFEETEWFYNRIFPAGYRIALCSDIRVEHYETGSQPSAASQEQLALSSYLFYYKLGSGVFFWACFLSALNLLTRLVLMPLAPHYWKGNMRHLQREGGRLLRALREVPTFPSAYASRPAPLLTPAYLKKFSWSRMSGYTLTRS